MLPGLSPEAELELLRQIQLDLYTGKVQNYTIGDRTITLFDMEVINRRIQVLQSVILERTPIVANLGGARGTLIPGIRKLP